MIRTVLLLWFLSFLFSCSQGKYTAEELFKKTMNINPFNSISEIQGDSKIVEPVFMSWGLLKYNVNKEFIKDIERYDSFSTSNSYNQRFEVISFDDFPKDLTYWTKFSKIKIDSNFNYKNCVFFYGQNFPFVHEIALDTVNYKVIHLICGMRD